MVVHRDFRRWEHSPRVVITRDPRLDERHEAFDQAMAQAYRDVEATVSLVYERFLEAHGPPPEGWQDRPEITLKGGVDAVKSTIQVSIIREPISESQRLRIDHYRAEIARLEGLLAVELAARFAR